MREVDISAQVNEYYSRRILDAASERPFEESDDASKRLFGHIAFLLFPTDRPLGSSSLVYPDGTERERFANLVQLYASIEKIVSSTPGSHTLVNLRAVVNKKGTAAAILGKPELGSATDSVFIQIQQAAARCIDKSEMSDMGIDRLSDPTVIIPLPRSIALSASSLSLAGLEAMCSRVNTMLDGLGSNKLPLHKPRVRERVSAGANYRKEVTSA